MNLDDLSEKGNEVLRHYDRSPAHLAFRSWIASVAKWLKDETPNSGLVSEWHALGDAHFISDNNFDDTDVFQALQLVVTKRQKWLSEIPARLQKLRQRNNNSSEPPFVDSARLDELRKIKNANFDLAKLIRLCEELEASSQSKCFMAMIMLTRAIIDHVPPIFGYSKFADFANQHGGAKSFKDSMLHLEDSSRKIADQYLHLQIRKSETLPTFTQVNFSRDLDVLLGEIVRFLK